MIKNQQTLLQIIGENQWDIFSHAMILQDGRLSRSRWGHCVLVGFEYAINRTKVELKPNSSGFWKAG